MSANGSVTACSECNSAAMHRAKQRRSRRLPSVRSQQNKQAKYQIAVPVTLKAAFQCAAMAWPGAAA